jgi:excisionase family DNA binding protein
MAELLYFNSQEAARLLGVNVSTIKRWTDEKKLACVKTRGGHRKFQLRHLAEFLDKHADKAEGTTFFPLTDEKDLGLSYHILKENYVFLADELYRLAIAVRQDKIQAILNGLYLAQAPLHRIYDHLVTPVLYRIGEEWHNGRLSMVEEHLATQVLRDGIIRLQGIIRLPERGKQRALCMNLSGELHDIALKMIHHLLEIRGFTVFYAGQQTPILEANAINPNNRYERIYISSTMIIDPEKEIGEWLAILDVLRQMSDEIFVGGRGFEILPHSKTDGITRLLTMEQVYNS